MKKKIFLAIISVILITLVTCLFLLAPNIKESKIKSAIEKANYCEVDSDCVDAGGRCPFGCYVYVNKNEVGKISKLIETYDSNCVYGCMLCPTAICENNKCKEVCG